MSLHSHIDLVLPLQLSSHCYCFCLYRGFYKTAIDGTDKDQKIILVTKEIKLFHLRVLLTSLNICSDRTEKLGNRIRMICYIVLR